MRRGCELLHKERRLPVLSGRRLCCLLLFVCQQDGQHSLLHMQAVLGFVEDLRRVLLKHGRRNFFAAVGGQAVQHQRVRLGGLQQLARELEAHKIPQALLALGGAGVAVFHTAVATTSASRTPSTGLEVKWKALPYLWASISTSAAGR